MNKFENFDILNKSLVWTVVKYNIYTY